MLLNLGFEVEVLEVLVEVSVEVLVEGLVGLGMF